MNAKITDFGLAKTKSHSQRNTETSTLGTVLWAAPECLTVKRFQERNEKMDVFSFGVIAWELVTQQVPWKQEGYSSKDIEQAVKRGSRLKITAKCPKYLQEVMKQCWEDSKQFKLFVALI